ncbi:MAG: hypothetical protein AB3N64_04130 [Puniceicoccaceae bacterium]
MPKGFRIPGIGLIRARIGALLLCAVALAGPLEANLTQSLQNFSISGPNGYLIDADGNNFLFYYNRDAIRAAVEMEYSRSGGSPYHYEYRFDFQLLNSDGVAQTLKSGGTTLSVWEDVDMTVGDTTIQRTTTGNLRPAAQLDPYDEYRVSVQVFRRVAPNGVITNTFISSETAPEQFIHFNQLTSPDAPYNVISEVESVFWNRTYRVQTEPARDHFRVTAFVRLHRYDDFTEAVSSDEITTRLSVTLRDDQGNSVPLEQSVFEFTNDLATYSQGNAQIFIPNAPATVLSQRVMEIVPSVQLESRARTYKIEVTVGHYESAGANLPLAGNNLDTANTRLLDFNGTIAFHGAEGTFTSTTTPGPSEDGLGADYIQTTLRINNNSGSFKGMIFGNGDPLPVELRDDGVATLSGGFIALNGTGIPEQPGKIAFTISTLVATPTDLTGTVNMQLPSGFGVGVDANTRIHEPNIFFFNVDLGPDLVPTSETLDDTQLRWAAEESKPLIFEIGSLSWDVQQDRIRLSPTGQIVYTRGKAYDTLLGDALVPAGKRFKLGNDAYYWKVAGIDSAEVLIEPHPQNCSAMLTMDLSLGGTLYRGHFPYNALISANKGSQRIIQDMVDPAYGGLEGVTSVDVNYARDCPEGDCGGEVGVETLTFLPDNDFLNFTRDGGLSATGVMNAPTTLNWGWVSAVGDYAQKASEFIDSGFLASGIFMSGSQYNSDSNNQPARMLLTGIDPNQTDVVERPATAAYTAGLGDYPGLNFRVVSNGAQDGEMVLAGQASDPFPLTDRAKYYVRYAGITGIHEAINGQFNPTAVIYGMDFTFTTLGWAYMDSEAVDSRTAGELSVPYPSDFDLAFDKLMISCQGALLGADIAASDANVLKKLAYWNADFLPLSLNFEGKDADFCDPSQRRLVLGVEAYAGGIPQPLSGRFGFQTNGNLITLASGDLDPPFDSRLALPNSFDIAGPENTDYRATPVGDAYLNDYDVLPDGLGWLSIPAFVDVPFFEDLQIHLHTTAVKDDDNPIIYMMGGYPDLGFSTNGKHFFNEAIYDVSNRGFPGDVTLEEYRNGISDMDEKYRPRAQTRWLGVVDFDYPLEWRAASKSFVSFTEAGNNFVVLYAQHQVDYLSSEIVEVSFGAGLSTFPVTNLANLVSDKATDATGVLQQYLETEIVNAGVEGLNEVLDVKQREFFEKVLEPAVDTAVDEIMDAITPNWDEVDKKWLNNDLASVIDTGALDQINGVFAQIDKALTTAKEAAGVIQEVDLRLGQAEDALTAIEEFIEEKEGAPLGNMEEVVLGLANIVSDALDKPEFAQKIDEILRKAEPRIVEVREAIVEVRDFISGVREKLAQGGAFTNQVIDLVADNTQTIEDSVTEITAAVEDILEDLQPGVDSLAAYDEALREKIKQRIMDYITELPIIAQYNRLLKQYLYDASSLLTQAIDEVFDQINLTLEEIISDVVGGLEEKFEEMLGDVATVMATADIKGYAKVRNDSLTELRLDLKASINIPDEMKAHVFLLIKELNSDNTPTECLPDAGKATEVTMGAKDVAVEWLFPGVSLNIAAKFVMAGGEGFPLLGMGGGIDLVGEISFADSIVIHQLGASVMFGKFENYISAGVQLEVQGFQGGGGIFFGRACSLDPFFWDPIVGEVIGEPPFTGFYGYGEFWIPINQLIGIPSTCLFNLSAGVGAGAGVFAEGPTVFGKMFLGVSGDLLCIVSITGEISLVGVAKPSGLSLAGEGRFQAEIGFCPICLKFDKTARLVKEGKKWSRSVD